MWENAGNQVAIGFSLESDCFKTWTNQPAKKSKAKAISNYSQHSIENLL